MKVSFLRKGLYKLFYMIQRAEISSFLYATRDAEPTMRPFESVGPLNQKFFIDIPIEWTRKRGKSCSIILISFRRHHFNGVVSYRT